MGRFLRLWSRFRAPLRLVAGAADQPSRMRLLFLLLSAAAVLPAQWNVLRSDPKIETLAMHDAGPADMDEKRVLVLPFESDQMGEPPPPDLAPHFSDALAAWLIAADVVVPRAPTAAGPDAARILGFDFLVRGRTEVYYQGGSAALKTRVWVELIDLSQDPGEIVWQGRKTARWARRKPPSDCLLYLASDFVADWLWEKH